ncbi:hypothetical protein PACTADRAFT_2113 [Pachysolen tannophilus NRRL Y-2460]|uniref:Protein FYV8 n=1 Tax=Pachysolen tannophilus NRRL Y-2460 TaxID=669874 RepID=A0A1E4TVJ3_PACTA|nr:hypothetical protein PACTADRAFT_2113 [Pachysolen tannophilus NRRL Y-2460]
MTENADVINRHRSERWVQAQRPSYGDDWNDHDNDMIVDNNNNNNDDDDDEAEAEAEANINVNYKAGIDEEEDEDEEAVSRPPVPKIPDQYLSADSDEALLSSSLLPFEAGTVDAELLRKLSNTNLIAADDDDDDDIQNNEAVGEDAAGRWKPTADIITPPVTRETKADLKNTDELEAELELSSHTHNNIENIPSSLNIYDDIEPTPPLKTSRKSSRNPSVNLDENNNDKLLQQKNLQLSSSSALQKNEKNRLTSNYKDIEHVVSDYLNQRDSQYYGETFQEDDLNKDGNKNINDNSDDDEEVDHDLNNTSFNSQHSDPHSQDEDLTNPMGVSSLSHSLSSGGSLSTGSWSVRSSAQFNATNTNTRETFIGKLLNERRPSVGNQTIDNETKEFYQVAKDDESTVMNKKYDNDVSSIEGDDDIVDGNAKKFHEGKSINFGHWKPDTSNFRNDFIKETNNDDNPSLFDNEGNNAAQTRLENHDVHDDRDNGNGIDDDDDDDVDDELSFNDAESKLNYITNDDIVNSRSNNDLVSYSSVDHKNEYLSDSDENHTINHDNDEIESTDTLNDGSSSNNKLSASLVNSSLESPLHLKKAVFSENSTANSDADESRDDSKDFKSRIVNENGVIVTPKKQRYTSLLSSDPIPNSATRNTSTSSSNAESNKGNRKSAGRSASNSSSKKKVSELVENNNNNFSIQEYTQFDFAKIDKISNPDLKIKELNNLRNAELKHNTGLHAWLSTELTKVNEYSQEQDALGPHTLKAYKDVSEGNVPHHHSVSQFLANDMSLLTRKHSINLTASNFKTHLSTNKIKSKVGDGTNLAKGIFSRSKKIMRTNNGV